MSKLLALFIFFPISFFSFDLNTSVSKSFSAAVTPAATPTPPESAKSDIIELDRDEIMRPCPPGYRCIGTSDSDMLLVVTISDTVSKNSSSKYSYTVSGGRIIGEGAKVSWDLTDTAPGTYQITVAVTDKSGTQLQTATKSITVRNYRDDGDRCLSACPDLSVDAPVMPTPAGETMVFTANVSGGVVDNLTYDWKISDGKIIEGQGTPVIRVATNPKMAGKAVEATANFKWDSECWEICNKTASANNSVATKKRRDK